MDQDSERERRIVSRWMTRCGAEMLGPTLDRAYPVEEANGFDEALKAIDAAERQLWGAAGEPDKNS